MDEEGDDRSPESNHLEIEEHHDALERVAPNARIVYEAVRREGEHELGRGVQALFWSGLAAGLSMGFSMVTEAALRAHLPHAEWTPIIAKFGYSVGFLIVILGRQQLFTENTLTPILQLLQRRDAATLGQVARLWVIVLAANLFGAALFAIAAAYTGAFAPEVARAMGSIGRETMAHGFGATLMRGIFAGWLVALIVWLMPFAETARVAVIIIITYVIGLAGFSHVIAGSVESMYLVAMAQASPADYFIVFFLPALIGNVIGGVSLVAAVNYAQVGLDS